MIRNFADLERAVNDARDRHERFREIRLREITQSIEEVMAGGVAEVDAVLTALSEPERRDLYQHFPQFLTDLMSARAGDQLQMMVTGARSLLKSDFREKSSRKANSADRVLSRVAFSVANAPKGREAEISRRLEKIDQASDNLFSVFGLWISARTRYGLRRLRGVISKK